MTRGLLVVSALSASLLAGCGNKGPELGHVTGTVKLDGAPLANASVQFLPTSGRPSYGSTDASGHYVLKFTESKPGAIPGDHTVRVSTHHRGDPETGTKAEPERIPAKYSGAKSELKKKVEPGANTIDIEISSKDGKVEQPAK
jgi:hypothetical protein